MQNKIECGGATVTFGPPNTELIEKLKSRLAEAEPLERELWEAFKKLRDELEPKLNKSRDEWAEAHDKLLALRECLKVAGGEL